MDLEYLNNKAHGFYVKYDKAKITRSLNYQDKAKHGLLLEEANGIKQYKLFENK